MFGSQSSGYSGLFYVLSHNRVNRTHSKHFSQFSTVYVISLSLKCEKCQRCKKKGLFWRQILPVRYVRPSEAMRDIQLAIKLSIWGSHENSRESRVRGARKERESFPPPFAAPPLARVFSRAAHFARQNWRRRDPGDISNFELTVLGTPLRHVTIILRVVQVYISVLSYLTRITKSFSFQNT